VVDAPQTMVNLTVELAATYLVGDGRWVVHNTNCRVWQYTQRHDSTAWGRLPKWFGNFRSIEDNILPVINGRLPANAQFSGQNLIPDPPNMGLLRLNPQLSVDYPKGVDFDLMGFPMLTARLLNAAFDAVEALYDSSQSTAFELLIAPLYALLRKSCTHQYVPLSG
jgi:hypothetical protein